MRNVIDKLVALFCIIVFVTFLVNHGQINFSAVDWVRKTTVDAIQSEEGQQYVEETKEISRNVLGTYSMDSRILYSALKNRQKQQKQKHYKRPLFYHVLMATPSRLKSTNQKKL